MTTQGEHSGVILFMSLDIAGSTAFKAQAQGRTDSLEWLEAFETFFREVPLIMMREKLDVICLKKLNLTKYNEPELTRWKEFLDKLKYPKAKVNIGLIGKYIELQDAYKSILEAFVHAGAINECKVDVINIHSEFIGALEKLLRTIKRVHEPVSSRRRAAAQELLARFLGHHGPLRLETLERTDNKFVRRTVRLRKR